jgi:hypothetical protein
MIGPERPGHWSGGHAPNTGRAYDFLKQGKRYTVAREFRDFDGDAHPAGETWEFVGYAFLPQDDGLSLFVSRTGDDEWHIRMQLRPDAQDAILSNLGAYIRPAVERE